MLKPCGIDAARRAASIGEVTIFLWVRRHMAPEKSRENSEIDNRYISGQHIANPTFWADVAGEYTMSCSVFDGTSWSHPDTITLNVAERDYNTPPSVNAGADVEIDAGDVDCTSTTSP